MLRCRWTVNDQLLVITGDVRIRHKHAVILEAYYLLQKLFNIKKILSKVYFKISFYSAQQECGCFHLVSLMLSPFCFSVSYYVVEFSCLVFQQEYLALFTNQNQVLLAHQHIYSEQGARQCGGCGGRRESETERRSGRRVGGERESSLQSFQGCFLNMALLGAC